MSYQKLYSLRAVTNPKFKAETIAYYSDDDFFKRFLFYALNPNVEYAISEDAIIRPYNDTENEVSFDSIFDICEYLESQEVNVKALKGIHEYLFGKCDIGERKLYIELLTGNLDLGIDAKLVNKIIPKLIPRSSKLKVRISDK